MVINTDPQQNKEMSVKWLCSDVTTCMCTVAPENFVPTTLKCHRNRSLSTFYFKHSNGVFSEVFIFTSSRKRRTGNAELIKRQRWMQLFLVKIKSAVTKSIVNKTCNRCWWPIRAGLQDKRYIKICTCVRFLWCLFFWVEALVKPFLHESAYRTVTRYFSLHFALAMDQQQKEIHFL